MITNMVLTIDLDALAANYRAIRDQVAPAHVAGVVKADGYGLGSIPVVRTLLAQGCQHFFVAMLGEAEALMPVIDGAATLYVLNGLLPGTEKTFAQLGARPVLNSLDQVQRWSALARSTGKRLPAALQVDSGMSRLGLPSEEVEMLLGRPDLLADIELHLLMSHLACADEPNDPANADQAARFLALAKHFPGVPLALDNSGGAFLPRGHFDLVRAGIALYGGAPLAKANPMRPVISLTAPIAQLRVIPAGAGVGYGLTYHASRSMRLATIPMGYADGWPRCLSNRGAAYIAGRRVPIIGRVSMDSLTIDVTDIPDVHLYEGAPVELIGPHQSLDQVAADAGTISYEILTQLSHRYERIYLPARDLDRSMF